MVVARFGPICGGGEGKGGGEGMVPTSVEEDVPQRYSSIAVAAKTLRSQSSRAEAPHKQQRRAGDGEVPSSSSPEGGVDGEAAAEGQQQQQRRRRQRRRRRTRKTSEVVLDNRTRIKRRVKYLLMKMRVDQNLLDAYSGEGWNGQSREKIRPEQELQRAEAQILHSKLAVREAMHELDDLGLEGSLNENAFDAEGRVYHEEIFCAKCKSQEALPDNDIILCDGACNRGFHQYCLEPPLATMNIPPGDEGWLCPVCECKLECIEVINAYLGTNFEVENSWEMLFAKEALMAAGGGTQDGADGDFPSSDSEDDDYDPEGGEKLANSESEGESDDGGEDREDSDSSGFKENEASASDKDELDPSDVANLKRLRRGRGGSSDSDDSEVSLVDEFKDGDAKLGLRRRGSQAEESASDEEAMVIGEKRHRKAVDYRRLHDEMFGNMEIDDDNIASEDEDWGPQRRRRTIPDDPSRPRPPQVRRRRARSALASGPQGESPGPAPGGEREKRMWRRLPDSAIEVLRRVVVVNTLPSKSRKEELATQLGLSFGQVHGWFKNQRHQALRKGLVSSRRRHRHLVAPSSKAVNAVNGVKAPASEQVAAAETMMFEDDNNSNAYLTEKLDEVQLRLLELKQTLEDFARNTRVVDDDDRSVEADNNFGNGGIGLPANGRRIVYIPVAEVRERPPVSAHTSAC